MSDSSSHAERNGLIAANVSVQVNTNSISNTGLRAVNAVITTGNGLRAGSGKVFLTNRNAIDRRRTADGIIAAVPVNAQLGSNDIRN